MRCQGVAIGLVSRVEVEQGSQSRLFRFARIDQKFTTIHTYIGRKALSSMLVLLQRDTREGKRCV